MDQFTKLGAVQAVVQFWNSLTSGQKLITAIFVASSVVLLCVVSAVATKPKMEVLFSGLQAEDAGAIVAKLQERKVEYQIDGGGAVIKVPSKDVAELRLQMATDGLPQGGTVGFELFDKTNLGLTEFQQRINYQRAIAGELTRTISEIDRVQQARVHIAMPEHNLFDKDDKHPQASVILKLSAGNTLGADQVAGIVHLVSSAVEGMKPNYVNVVDTRGNVLSEASDTDSPFDARLTATQIDVKQTYERQLQKNIESMLESVLGPNKAIVRVNTKVNFDQKETDSEIYEPVKAAAQQGTVVETGQPVAGYKGVLLSESKTEETYAPNSGVADGSSTVGGIPGRIGGAAGVRPNVHPTSASTASVSGSGYVRQETSSKYEVSKTTQHVVETPGSIQQVSVAVMLDGKVDPGQIPAIRRVVEASAGIDAKRGDKVIVESVPFDDTAAKADEKEMQAAASTERNLSLGKTAGGVILLAGFAFFLRKSMRGLSSSSPASLGVPQPVPATPMTYSPMATPVPVGAAVASGPAPPGVPALQTISQDPQEVAQVVREWLSN